MFHLYQIYRTGAYYVIESDCSIKAYGILEWRTKPNISANVMYKPTTREDMKSYLRDARIPPAWCTWILP